MENLEIDEKSREMARIITDALFNRSVQIEDDLAAANERLYGSNWREEEKELEAHYSRSNRSGQIDNGEEEND